MAYFLSIVFTFKFASKQAGRKQAILLDFEIKSEIETPVVKQFTKGENRQMFTLAIRAQG